MVFGKCVIFGNSTDRFVTFPSQIEMWAGKFDLGITSKSIDMHVVLKTIFHHCVISYTWSYCVFGGGVGVLVFGYRMD